MAPWLFDFPVVAAIARGPLRFRRLWNAVAVAALVPTLLWAAGTAMVWLVPPLYESAALVELGECGATSIPERQELALIRSQAVAGEASRRLELASRPGISDGMAACALKSALMVEIVDDGLLSIKTRDPDPRRARRMTQEIVTAYAKARAARFPATEPVVVHAGPTVPETLQAGAGARMALGLSGGGVLALLASIPLIGFLERTFPARLAATMA